MVRKYKIGIVIFFLFALTSKSKADKIDKIAHFLEKFSTLTANFIQINNSGESLSGKIFIQRPGKLRIDYDDPNPNLIISDSLRLAHINRDIPYINIYSLKQLPIRMLLSNDFSMSNYPILNYKENNKVVEIEISKKNEEDLGSIILVFEDSPVKLKKWIIKEVNNTKTEIYLSNLLIDTKIENNLFKIEDPRKLPFGKKD